MSKPCVGCKPIVKGFGFWFSVVWPSIAGTVVPDILEVHVVFIFKGCYVQFCMVMCSPYHQAGFTIVRPLYDLTRNCHKLSKVSRYKAAVILSTGSH